MTSGESAFVEFCQEYGISCKRVPEESDRKTPDFWLDCDGTKMLIEIKDVQSNGDEKTALEDLNEHGFAVWGTGKVGARVRRKIEKARSQLKGARGDGVSAILLLYDSRDPVTASLSDYEILVAMYGYEAIQVEGEHEGRRRFGGSAQMTASTRTYISAVGVLSSDLGLRIYLNWFATVPLAPGAFPRAAPVEVYSLQSDPRNGFGCWTRVHFSHDSKST